MDSSPAHDVDRSSSDRCLDHILPRQTVVGIGKFQAGACVLVALTTMTGCRSSMPKFNMFGFKKEPSAEALAGVGPTATYPVSPSAGVTPEAIVSTASGATAPSGMKPQTGSVASAPSYGQAVPVSTGTPVTNPAAAASNGFYGASGTKLSTPTTPASYANATGTSGGTTYDQNPNVEKPLSGTAAIAASYSPNKPVAAPSGLPGYAQTGPTAPTSVQAYSAVPGYPLPGSTSPVATASAVLPTVAATPSQLAMAPMPQTPAAPTSSSTTSTFSMPPVPSLPAESSAAPTANPMASISPAPTSGGFAMPPVAATPSASVASVPEAPAPARVAAPTVPSTGGYKPGSTSGAVSYPAGDYPSTSGETFYR